MNYSLTLKGEKLVIEVDVSKAILDAAEPSKSGKTRVVASSNGFTGFATPNGTIRLNLNVIK